MRRKKRGGAGAESGTVMGRRDGLCWALLEQPQIRVAKLNEDFGVLIKQLGKCPFDTLRWATRVWETRNGVFAF